MPLHQRHPILSAVPSCVVYLIVLFQTLVTSDAFSHNPSFRVMRHRQQPYFSPKQGQYQIKPPNRICSINMGVSWLEEDDSSSSASLINRISSENAGATGTLARLAVAFSPPERQLSLKNIAGVYVVNVDSDHIEIVAEVCDEAECVTLFVPVQFPRHCGVDDLEACVLDNLRTLEEEAVSKLKLNNGNEMEDEDECDYTEEDSMLSCPRIDGALPQWWIQPEYSNSALIEECDTMIRLLNDKDFQVDMNALASRGLAYLDQGTSTPVTVQKAKVFALGPAGLLIRARITADQPYGNGGENEWIVEIPYPFGGLGSDTASLRAIVLGAFAELQI